MTDFKHVLKRAHRASWTSILVLGATVVALGCGGGGYGGGGSTTPPPTIAIAVNPTTIVLGQSTTLTWTASAGSTCTASGGWTGTQTATGTATETPTASGTVTYTLMCTGSGAYGGSTTGSATLTVNAPTSFSSTALVGDTAGAALVQDTNLVNPWGIAFSPTSFAWVANNGSGTSTLYDGNGVPQPFATPLIVSLPAAGATSFDPSGIVFNGTGGFPVTNGTTTSTALFIFSGEGGMIGGWAPSVDSTHVIAMYTDAGGAVYKGLALAKNGTANFLYATDFHNNKVDVFDTTFAKQTTSATSFTFVDPNLPAGYAPFGIMAANTGTGGATQIYVTYAQQAAPDNHDNTNGAGLGLVDVYDTNGAFVSRLVTTGGKLNAPWGMAIAPSDFGSLSGALLVGNFGDGTVNGYDPTTGNFVGTVADSTGTAFAAPGLWGIAFGNDAHNQPHNTLFYAAGLNNEANGVYGRIDLGAAPVLGASPVVTLTAPTGTVSGTTVALTATVVDSLGVSKVEFFLNGTTSLGVATTSPYTVTWDSTTVADGAVTIKATATDPDGHVGSSAVANITVQNTTPATTLTTIQANVFGPICSGCHSGVGTTLPGSQNLTTKAASFAALVGVASTEVPTIERVKANDATNSYLIQKLEGAPGIVGSQMPKGGTPLDQATIDQIKSWINAGAQNN
jgi:uncharacterized protein (TIGR03118 family)